MRIVTHLELFLHTCLEIGIGIGSTLWQFRRTQPTESLFNHRFGGLGVKITDNDKRHIIRHIPGVVEFYQFTQTRILQVFRFADDVTLVRMPFVEFLKQMVTHLRLQVVGIHIIFLEHVLQFCLESAEYRFVQTVGEDSQPFEHLVSGERVVIASHVITGEGIDAGGTYAIHQGKEILCGAHFRFFNGSTIDLLNNCVPLHLIGCFSQKVIQTDDFFVIRFLFLPIQGTDTLCTFEKHVLQIMRQAGILLRLINSTCADSHIACDIRLVMVFPKKNGETIRQRVFTQALTGLGGYG